MEKVDTFEHRLDEMSAACSTGTACTNLDHYGLKDDWASRSARFTFCR